MSPSIDVASTVVAAGDHAAVADRAGYVLEGLLWRDGLSLSYRARHRHLLDRVVVFKAADPHHPQPDLCARLLTWEARVLSRLDQPGVVRLHDFGMAGPTPYLLLEFPPHGRLLDQLRLARLPLTQAVSLVTGLAKTVQTLHQQGIVHGDLAPAYVWLTGDGSARLAHFELSTSAGDCVLRTAGTPPYLAPEKVVGAEVGPAVDVFGLGAVLSE